MRRFKTSFIIIMVFTVLSAACLGLCEFISNMSFYNSSLELRRAQIETEIGDIMDKVETSLSFGKSLESYYGIDTVLEQICGVEEGAVEAVMLDREDQILYTSYEAEDKKSLASVLDDSFTERLKDTAVDTYVIAESGYQYLVFPIWMNKETYLGNMVAVYLPDSSALRSGGGKWILLVILGTMVLLLCAGLRMFAEKPRKVLNRWMNLLVIAGMLAMSVCLYQKDKQQYETMIRDNAESAAEHIAGNLSGLLEKGLTEDGLMHMPDYLKSQIETNKVCREIHLVSGEDQQKHSGVIVRDIPAAEDLKLKFVIEQGYQQKLLLTMALTFASIILISMMIAIELFRLAEVIDKRISKDFGSGSEEQRHGMTLQIKLLSFFLYTGIYISISYTAVIMRNRESRVFGLSESLSAALPLTVELTMMMLFSLLLPGICRRMKQKEVLFLAAVLLGVGNLACMRVTDPYWLILLRAYCGVGFAFAKYFLNIMVASASENEFKLNYNYAGMNAGVLGGITAGAALGGVLAGASGYQSNYGYTLAVVIVSVVSAFLLVPWEFLENAQNCAVEEEPGFGGKQAAGGSLWNPSALICLFLGSVPLNIGLMYVVSFLPVYMNAQGYSALSVSYAYMINGMAGIYIGTGLVSFLKKISRRMSAAAAFFFAGMGILVLVTGRSLGTVFLSAGLMGLFDGYGTPSITGIYTNHQALARYDKAELLAVFNTVGSGIQIVCPILYNLLIRPDGGSRNLAVMGGAFLAVGAVFYMMLGKEGKCSEKNIHLQ